MNKETFIIELPKLDYLVGDIVRGKLIYEAKNDKRIHGIHIHFFGSEFCEYSLLSEVPYRKKWILDGTTTIYGNKIPRIDPSKRMYLNKSTEKYKDEDCVVIKGGKYSWPFSFRIPQNVPPSFDFRNGKLKVEYILFSFITVPWGMSSNCKKILTIGIPFCNSPEKVPNVFKKEKITFLQGERQLGGFRKALELEGYTEKPNAHSGSKVDLHLKVHNFSGKTVKSLKIKVRRHIFFGSSNDKQTVLKIKHIDKQFPLGHGIWNGYIPLVMPNLDLKPTVQNSSLCKVNYYISIRAQVHIGSDLIVRIPIIISPRIPEVKKENVEEQVQEEIMKLDESKEEKYNNPQADFEWDAPNDDIKLPPPLEPSKFNLSNIKKKDELDSDDSDNEEDLEFNKIISSLNHDISELDSLEQLTESGLLVEVLGFSNPHFNYNKCFQDIENSLRNIDKEESNLRESVGIRSNDLFLNSIQSLAKSFNLLSELSKSAASSYKEIQQQLSMIQQTKNLLISGQQSIISGKDAMNFDPFMSSNDNEYTSQIMELALKSVEENSRDLLNLVCQSGEKKNMNSNLEEATEQINEALNYYSNPFLDQGNEEVTFEHFEKESQQILQSLPYLISDPHNLSIEEPKQLSILISNLLRDTKSVAKKNPSNSQELLESVKKVAVFTKKLLEIAKNKEYQSFEEREALSIEMLQITSKMNSLTVKRVQEGETMKIMEEEKEFPKIVNSLEKVTQRIEKNQQDQTMSLVPQRNEDELESYVCRFSKAISCLLDAVHKTQQDLPSSSLECYQVRKTFLIFNNFEGNIWI